MLYPKMFTDDRNIKMLNSNLVQIGLYTGICLVNCIEAATTGGNPLPVVTTESVTTTSTVRPTTVQTTTEEATTFTPPHVSSCGTGCIVGSVIGSVVGVVVLILVVLSVLYCRKKKRCFFSKGSDSDSRLNPLPSGEELDSFSKKKSIQRISKFKKETPVVQTYNPNLTAPTTVPGGSSPPKDCQRSTSEVPPSSEPSYVNTQDPEFRQPVYANREIEKEEYYNKEAIDNLQINNKDNDIKSTSSRQIDALPPSKCSHTGSKSHDYINVPNVSREPSHVQEDYMCMNGNSKKNTAAPPVARKSKTNVSARSDYNNLDDR